MASGDKWHVGQRRLKLHFKTLEKWKSLARKLELPEDFVISQLLQLYFSMTLERRTWLSGPELAKVLRPGAAAYMGALQLAENRNGQVVLLDVEATVNESLMRRNVSLRSLPAVRARDLAGGLRKMFEQVTGIDWSPGESDQRTIELMRARAADSEILKRWERALLSHGVLQVRTLQQLNQTWERWA